MDSINFYRKIVILAESERESLVQEKLPFDLKDLDPVMSEETLNYHYGKLASGYVKRYNDKEGDDEFNYGGATLHNIFFPQLQKPSSRNNPTGISAEKINKRWGDFQKFKEAFQKAAMGVQGSGWVYMDTDGNISTIHNHEYKKNMKIALLVDWWEHAWALDYQHDKQKYLESVWRIINWSIINDRIQGA
jgi:superoxide dismutase, Fe-Mn family